MRSAHVIVLIIILMPWTFGADWKQTNVQKMYMLWLRAKYVICIKKRHRIPWRPRTSFAPARSNFVTANQNNWIFLLEEISPSALPPARSGKEINGWLLTAISWAPLVSWGRFWLCFLVMFLPTGGNFACACVVTTTGLVSTSTVVQFATDFLVNNEGCLVFLSIYGFS